MSIPTLSSTSITDVDDVSTLLMMPLVTTSTSTNYPPLPTSMDDLIAEHDRPYAEYGHLSMIHVLVKINIFYYYS